MVNYKGFQTLQTTGGRTIGNPPTLIHLTLETPTTITADSFNDAASAYQVTAGKTFQSIGIILSGPAATGRVFIYQGDTENAQTLLKFQIRSFGNTTVVEIPTDFTIAAGKFVTGIPSTTTTITGLIIIGYEK